MRINSTPAAIGGIKGESNTPLSALPIEEGDVLDAKILLSDKGNVSLKTQDGQIIRAKLKGDVNLAPGDKVSLIVEEKTESTIVLSLNREQSGPEQGGAPPAAMDKALAAFAAKLTQLQLPVNEETALKMRELMAANPEMTMEESAFIASNGIPEEAGLYQAAKRLIGEGAKTGRMVDSMIETLKSMPQEENTTQGPAKTGNVRELLDRTFASVREGAAFGAGAARGEMDVKPGAPLTEWLAKLLEQDAEPVLEKPGQAVLKFLSGMPEFKGTPEKTLAKFADMLISAAEQGIEEGSTATEPLKLTEEQLSKAAAQAETPEKTNPGKVMPESVKLAEEVSAKVSAQTETPEKANPGKVMPESAKLAEEVSAKVSAQTETPEKANPGKIMPESAKLAEEVSAKVSAQTETPEKANPGKIMPESAKLTEEVSVKAASQTESPEKARPGEMAAEPSRLQERPEFKGAPERTLVKSDDPQTGTVQPNIEEPAGAASKLTKLLDDLFAKLPLRSEAAGESIKRAKDELYVRLSFFEEALSRSNAPGKEALMAETRKLMDHIKLLNSIDQFVYMQIPIKLGEDRRTAELYIYKQKNSGGVKKIDPENVSILLALDLQHMGHLESFVKIRGREVSLQVEVSSEDAKTFFSDSTVALHGLLSEIGYKLADTKVSYSAEETTPLTALFSLVSHEKRTVAGINYII